MMKNVRAGGMVGNSASPGDGEQGFMLLGLIVAIGIILLVLGVAASKTAFSLHREREVESARRANQYVRAIRRFYWKNGNRYPASIEQLENTNLVRYLRQRYVDPLTGKADYRLIPVGQNKTTPKAFFGQPLSGIPGVGLGSAEGMQSTGNTGGAPGTGGMNGTSPTGVGGSTDAGGSSLGALSGLASQFDSSGTMGPFMGVGSSATGPSILVVNQQTTYETWEFLYDPRVERLKAAAALNAGVGTTAAGALGTTPGALGSTTGTNPTNTTGTTPPGTPPPAGTPAPQP